MIKTLNGLFGIKTIKLDKWLFGNEVEYTDFILYKGERIHSSGPLDFRIFQKSINRDMYIYMLHTQLKIAC